jgi:hypothetical protein
MKICFKINKGTVSKKEIEIIKKFCSLLMKKMKLSNDITIEFLNKKVKDMTTGSYNNGKSRIRILSKGRMLADIFRTLSHEWAHAYDNEKLKIKDRKDIGGESENFANAKSGELTKLFIKKNKNKEKEIFN